MSSSTPDYTHHDQRVVDMYHQACNIGQATRNDFIQLLSNPDMGNIIVGTCVRVLLELQDFSEDYMVARVQGIQPGESYSGFSQNANQATTIHLRLQLPSRFSGGNGNLYQLNSISNSPLTRHEVEVWLSLTAQEGRPEASSFMAAGSRLRAVVPARQRRGGGANGGAAPPANPQNNNNNAPPPAGLGVTVSNVDLRRGGGPNLVSASSSSAPHPSSSAASANPPAATVAKRERSSVPENSPSGKGRSAAKAEMASEALEVQDRDLVYQMILKEKSVDKTLFKRTCENMRTSDLRTLERDVAEYLDRVREAISSNQQRCVVCMDQVPTVIIMPCRHRVLCRWCTLKVESCPMCRGVATELFEPIEQ